MKKKYFAFAYILFFYSLLAQQNNLKETFPLAVGKTWVYSFSTGAVSSMSHSSTIDSGIVKLEIMSKIDSPDSTRWQFYQRREYFHDVYGVPVSGWKKDSSSFEIIELKIGLHELYVNSFDKNSIFPYYKTSVDSEKIFRYSYASPSNLFIKVRGKNNGYENDYYVFTFGVDTGVVKSKRSWYNASSMRNWSRYYFNAFEEIVPPQTIGWVSQNPLPSSQWIDFTSAFFLNDNEGWIVGGWPRKVFHTTNGGENWILQSLPESSETQWLSSIYFISDRKGWTVGGPNEGGDAKILTTNNGGLSWQNQNIDNVSFLRSVYFVSETTGFTVGNDGVILKTTDGGDHWTSKTSGTTEMLKSVFFSSPSIGWVVGTSSTVLKTTDGGENWTKIALEPGVSYWSYYSVYFINQLKGWITTDYYVYMTEDGGSSWIKQYTSQEGIVSIFFQTPEIGWAVGGQGIIIKTTNGGSTWTEQSSPTQNHLTSVYFVSPTTGWVVGVDGTVLKTINGGGITSVNLEGDSKLQNDYSLSQNYPNPFNPTTTINFSITKQSNVTIKIYDLLGREITTLVNEEKPTGNYSIHFNGSNLSSGIYFYQLKVNNFTETKKMILLR